MTPQRCTHAHAYAVTGERGALLGHVVPTGEEALTQWAASGDRARGFTAAHLNGLPCRAEEQRLAALAARDAEIGRREQDALDGQALAALMVAAEHLLLDRVPAPQHRRALRAAIDAVEERFFGALTAAAQTPTTEAGSR